MSVTAARAPASKQRWSFDRLGTAVSTGRGVLYGPRHLTLLLFAVGVLLVGFNGSAALRYGLILSTVYGVAVLGNNAIHAAFGEINLSAGAFMAVGAYTVAYSVNHGVNILLAIALAAVIAAVAGLIAAIPISRLGGLAIALVTFALAYSINDLSLYLEKLTGGATGTYVPADYTLGGMSVAGSGTGMLVVAVAVMVVVGAGHMYLLNRRPGRVALLVGEAPTAAASFGYSTHRVKIMVWTWAAFLSGISGALYALTVGYLSSEQWLISLSIFVFVGGLVGGTRSAVGAWIGGIVVGGLQLWLQNFVPPATSTVVYGVILFLALVAGGKGVTEQIERGVVAIARRLRGGR